MTAGQVYNFKVVARNSAGWGDESAVIAVMAAGAPAKPVLTSLEYDSVNEWYILEWDTIDNNGDPITSINTSA